MFSAPSFCEQPRPAEHMAHRRVRLGQRQRDASPVELAVELLQRLRRGDVQVEHRAAIEDDHPHRRRGGVDELVDLLAEEARVGEEERRVDAVDDEPGQRLAVRPVLDILVAGLAPQPPQHRVVRVRSAPDQIRDRERHRHQHAREDAENQHAHERRHREEALDHRTRQMRTNPRTSKSEIAEAITTAPSRAFGSRAMIGARRKIDGGDDRGGDQSGGLRSRAGGIVDDRARVASGGRYAVDEARREVGRREPEQLALALNS